MQATRVPVLVGIGTATQREEDWRRAREPLDLMLDAVRAAGVDSGAPMLLAEVDYLAVPHGRWRYRNPGSALAHEIGAVDAQSVFASVGVLQQSLIGEACARIAAGEARATLVVGGDCGYRLLRASIAGEEVRDRQQDHPPDVHLAPKDALFHPVEQALGLTMPIGLYAIIESAWRRRHGWSVDEHRARLGALYARFSDIAADNPHAWHRERRAAADIVAPGPRNPMQAFPYTRALCSTFNVDQAGALLFCSAARADDLGIAHEQRVYPLASTESNHQVPVSARAELTACPGARLAGERALQVAGLGIDDLDLVELYSCFPAAVEIYAAELGLDLARDVTLTGGMSFAGGPWNNYVLQATCRAAQLLRAGRGRHALVSSVSGMLTKQGFGLFGASPPSTPFAWRDVSAATAQAQATVDVLASHTGRGRLAGYTTLHRRDQLPGLLALVDTADGRRALVNEAAPALLARLEAEEWVGREVNVRGAALELA